MAKQLEGKFCLIPGKKLCRECWMYTKNILDGYNSPSEDASMQELSLSEDARESSESSSAENYSTLLDDSLAACKVSPFKSTRKSKRQKLFHGSQKIEKVTKKFEKAFSTKGVDIAIYCTPSITRSTDEKDFDQLMFELKTKFQQTTSLNEKIQILTLKPKSWTIEQTVKFFNATTYQVRTAMTLKKNEGVLSKPKRSVRKGIDQDSINNVISFYLDDEFSREMPGAKEYVSIGYKQDSQEKVAVQSMAFFSNDLEHNTGFVYQVQKLLCNYLQLLYPSITNIQYFSDGCSTQYKNYKNLLNLTFHKQDFGFDVVWNFFATSHGKSPCDRLGGTIKRKLTIESLSRTKTNPIFTALQAYEFFKNTMNTVELFYIPKDDLTQVHTKLKTRYELGHTVPRTHSYVFIPQNIRIISFKRIGEDKEISGQHSFFNPNKLQSSQIIKTMLQLCTTIIGGLVWLLLLKVFQWKQKSSLCLHMARQETSFGHKEITFAGFPMITF